MLPDNEWIFDHNYVDHFVCGEGEAILHKILTNKKTKRVYIEKNKINYLSPYLAKTLPISSGDPVLIEAQRGCPFKCTFCYYPKSKQQISVLSLRDIEAIIRMALRKNVRDIIFIDPTFNNYPDFNKLLNLLIELNKEKRIKYHAEIKPHLLSKEQINLINKAGFESLEVGLQTVNKSTQKTINCFIPLEKFRDNLKLFHKSISLRVDLLAGLPNETLNDIKSGMKYVKKNLPKSDCYLYHVSAIPGTALRRSLNKKNYQHRPPYFVLNNGKIGIKEICKANSFFEKTFDEELDSMPDLNDIYKKRGKYNYFLITPKNISRYKANSISLFNVLEFKSVKFNERFFHQTLQIINRATASNPFCTFYFFISSSCFDRTRVLEGIFSSSKLAYNQYVNNCRICSPEEIANLRVGFINERKNK